MSCFAFATSVGGGGRLIAPGHSSEIQFPSIGESPPSSAALIA